MENIDKYGHCVVCHRSLIVERSVDGQVIKMFTPDHDQTNFLLKDGSNMRVCICKPCKEGVNLDSPKVKKYIMEAVINGWRLEVQSLIANNEKELWDDKYGQEHMKRYGQLEIDCHSENLGKHVIEDRKKELVKGDGVRL